VFAQAINDRPRIQSLLYLLEGSGFDSHDPGSSRLQILLRGSPYSFCEEEIIHNRRIFMANRIVLELFFRQVGLEIIERHFRPDEKIYLKRIALAAKIDVASPGKSLRSR
jgi:hypothetical protein